MYPKITLININRSSLVVFERDLNNPLNEGFIIFWEIINSNNKQLMSIQTSLESIREEYNIGTKTITDLIDAESELLTVNVNYHSSKKV